MELVDRVAGRTNLNVASDLEVAALLLDSAARAAAANVRANLPSVGDEGYASAVTAELGQRLQQIQSTATARASASPRARFAGRKGSRPRSQPPRAMKSASATSRPSTAPPPA